MVVFLIIGFNLKIVVGSEAIVTETKPIVEFLKDNCAALDINNKQEVDAVNKKISEYFKNAVNNCKNKDPLELEENGFSDGFENVKLASGVDKCKNDGVSKVMMVFEIDGVCKGANFICFNLIGRLGSCDKKFEKLGELVLKNEDDLKNNLTIELVDFNTDESILKSDAFVINQSCDNSYDELSVSSGFGNVVNKSKLKFGTETKFKINVRDKKMNDEILYSTDCVFNLKLQENPGTELIKK